MIQFFEVFAIHPQTFNYNRKITSFQLDFEYLLRVNKTRLNQTDSQQLDAIFCFYVEIYNLKA